MKRLVIALILLLPAAAVWGLPLDRDAYYQKVLGCWNGKCIGGGLGMPVEGAWWQDQLKNYPMVDGYVGYIGNVIRSWSGFLARAEVPMDGEWHEIVFSVKVPDFPKGQFPAPIIGMSLEEYNERSAILVRDIAITSHPVPLAKKMRTDFNGTNSCWYDTGLEAWVLDFPGEGGRSWIKTNNFSKFGTDIIKSGDTFTIKMNAKWLQGDNHFGFAFDFMDTDGSGFGPDDDTSYQIIGLLGLEKYGPSLTSEQIGRLWTERITIGLPDYLAEGIALERLRKGIMPPESGDHPVGNAIGGQMKGEIWGLVCPGRPDLAAEYARRDGVVAHKEDGVYGEMFVAAMISEAFVESDVKKIIKRALLEIPAESKYACMVQRVLDEYEEGRTWVQILRDVKKDYPSMCDPVYPECAIITLALLEGKGDFDYTVITAFYCGSDTDCDTATVGAVIGTVIGYDAIPDKWKKPINNTFRCFVAGQENLKITGLCRRICRQGERVLRYHGGRL
ncbi:MAG: ADP-ribosylglycohydrolase family protein [Abditibacteriota bacterium]|nr:ADP-ribosylglycohydrolase family protein [Abditibacteriota bacterium]